MIARALLRFLARTPLSTLMALLGVALGVTSIVSVHLISATVAQRLDDLIPRQLAGYSHFLHHADISAARYFALRRAWREGAAAQIERMSPLIDEAAVLDGHKVRLLGVDLLALGGGELDVAPAVRENTFDWRGVWADETVAEHLSLPLNGIVAAPPGTVVGDIGVVQDLLGWSAERISYVGVNIAAPWRWLEALGEALLPGLGAGLPERGGVLEGLPEWRLVSLAEQHPASQFGKSVLFNISALGALALLVAWFLMYQVAVSWLRRLWPVFERLHVLGVTWLELTGYFALAMAVLGATAGLLGLGAGFWLADFLYAAALPEGRLQIGIDGWVVMKALGSSMGVCVLGGLVALRRARTSRQPRGRLAWLLVLLAVAVTGILSEASGLLGGFAAIAVLSLLTAFAVVPLLSALRVHSARLGGPLLVRLSVRELVWYPREFSIALAGLSLAVATAIGVGLMVDSFREDFSSMLDRRLTYDLAVEADAEALERLVAPLSADPRVERLQRYAGGTLRVGGTPVDLTVTRVDVYEARRYGLARPLGAGELLVSEQGARSLGVRAGERLTVAGVELTVAAVFSSFGDLQPRLIVDEASALDDVLDLELSSLRLNTAAPADLLNWLRLQAPAAEVELQSDLREVALETFDQTFTITGVLITIALLVAGIGVYVAVTTARLNRRSSERLLRGLGVLPVESAGMDFALGVGLGAVAVLLAWPLGVAFGWILCDVINPRAFGWTVALKLSADAMLIPLMWGLVAAGLAGLLRFGRSEEGTHVARA